MVKTKKTIEEMSDEHWEFVVGILVRANLDANTEGMALIEYLYKQAIIHGYKHGIEEKK